jgi:hypothetical protein
MPPAKSGRPASSASAIGAADQSNQVVRPTSALSA